jgi:putative DNA primase/helicase
MAGELATRAGITGWPEGESFAAAERCLAAWMADRGHSANQEDRAALEQVRDFFTRNQYSRFADWHDDKNRPVAMMGFRKVDKGNTNTETVTTFMFCHRDGRKSVKDLMPVRLRDFVLMRGGLKQGRTGVPR